MKAETRGKVLVSACLLGEKTRYDGRDGALTPHASAVLAPWQARGLVVGFCPEMAGGLPVPRPAAEISPGHDGADVLAGCARVETRDGTDQSAAFVAGAQAALARAQAEGCVCALLCERSPSCGIALIHDGSFSGTLTPGAGVTTSLLRANRIEVFSPEQIDRLAILLNR